MTIVALVATRVMKWICRGTSESTVIIQIPAIGFPGTYHSRTCMISEDIPGKSGGRFFIVWIIRVDV